MQRCNHIIIQCVCEATRFRIAFFTAKAWNAFFYRQLVPIASPYAPLEPGMAESLPYTLTRWLAGYTVPLVFLFARIHNYPV